MFCSKCGNEVNDGTNFCKKCGSQIEVNNNVNSLNNQMQNNNFQNNIPNQNNSSTPIKNSASQLSGIANIFGFLSLLINPLMIFSICGIVLAVIALAMNVEKNSAITKKSFIALGASSVGVIIFIVNFVLLTS